MRNPKHNSLIYTIFVLSTISILQLCHCRVLNLQPNDAKLIEDTCKKTPKPSLCLQLLKSDSRSKDSDINGLALIMVDIIMAKSKGTMTKIKKLLEEGGGKKKALHSCGSKYNAIIVGDVPQARDGIRFGNTKFAEDAVSDSAIEAIACEDEFLSGKSPLTNENNEMRDISNVARAILRLLL